MSDSVDTKIVETPVDDSKSLLPLDAPPVTKVQESEQSFKDRVVSAIKGVLLGESSDTDGNSITDGNIPDEFSTAATAAGWSDAEIIEFANTKKDQELLDLIPHLAPKTSNVDDISVDKIKESKIVSKDVKQDAVTKDENKLQQDVDALIEKLLPKLQEKLNVNTDETKKVLEEIKLQKDQEFIKNTLGRADQLMDDLSKEFPEFGLRKDMPMFPAGDVKGQLIPTSPQFKARSELYDFAVSFMGRGQNVDDAMTNAIHTYRGKYLKEQTERDVIKDLKRHEQRLSGPRTAKDTKKTYSNDREEGIDVVQSLLDSQGQR